MKKPTLSFLVFVLLAAAKTAAGSEAALDLAAAVREGRQNSPELARMQAEADSASWKRLESASPQLPRLTASYNQILDTRYLYVGERLGGASMQFPSASPSSLIGVSLSLTVFDGLETWRSWQASELGYEAAQADLKRAEFQLEETVRLRYYQALAAQALLQVADKNIATLEEHLAIANAGQRSGMTTRFNVLRIEAQLEEARAEKNLAEDNAFLARRNLAQAMGLAEDARPLAGELLTPSAALPADLPADGKDRDDIRAQQAREAAALKSRQAAAGFWWPKVSLYVDEQYYKYKSYDPAILDSDRFKNAYAAGARLTWNLFDGGASLARQAQAGFRAKQAEEASRSLRLRSANDLETWKRRLIYNASLYRARLRTEEKSKESVRLATLGLKAGTNTHTEVLDAELDLFRSRAGIIRAQMDAAEALINLELAVGRPLPPGV